MSEPEECGDLSREDLDRMLADVDEFRPLPRWRHWATLSWLVLALAYLGLGFYQLWSDKPGHGANSLINGLFLILFTMAYSAMWSRAEQARRLNRILLHKLSEERRRGQFAADARHERNRIRTAEAMEFYKSREWRTNAEAARAIADRWKVEPKTAERWILGWKRIEGG